MYDITTRELLVLLDQSVSIEARTAKASTELERVLSVPATSCACAHRHEVEARLAVLPQKGAPLPASKGLTSATIFMELSGLDLLQVQDLVHNLVYVVRRFDNFRNAIGCLRHPLITSAPFFRSFLNVGYRTLAGNQGGA